MYVFNKQDANTEIPTYCRAGIGALFLMRKHQQTGNNRCYTTQVRFVVCCVASGRKPDGRQMANGWHTEASWSIRGECSQYIHRIRGYALKKKKVTYLWHRQDPLIDDDILIDNMRYIVRGTLRDLYTEYTTGALPTDHLQFLETYRSHVLELRVSCETVEVDCFRPGWVKYLQGSIWFDLCPGTLQRNPLGFRWNGDYSCRITVVAPHSAVTDVVIQLFESEDGSISCLSLAGEEVLSVPPNKDAQMLRHKLGRLKLHGIKRQKVPKIHGLKKNQKNHSLACKKSGRFWSTKRTPM